MGQAACCVRRRIPDRARARGPVYLAECDRPGAPRTERPSSTVQAMTRSFDEYRDTPLWRALSATLRELEASGEIRIETAPDYVIGYLCRELAAKWVIASVALTRDR